MTKQSISILVEMARSVVVSDEDRKEQRRSFVYGNTAFENKAITKELVDSQARLAG